MHAVNTAGKTVAALIATAAMLAGCASMDEGMRTAHAAQPGKNRVVIQVSDAEPAKWNLALNNAKNVQADLDAANVEIEIVAYGPGIGMIKAGSPVAMRIDEATMTGMKVVACENTMTNMKLTKADMLKGLEYVPAGVVEIMHRQQQGWAYVRP
jgi:intracellular sulfur oxidation DsrE/DsrF family protein